MLRVLAGALSVAVLMTGCSDASDEPDAEPRPSATGSPSEEPGSTAPTDVGPIVECPRDVVEIDPELPDAVPEGATSVRLCDGGADEVAAPVDALTTDVASVVAAVNDQPVVTRNCADRQLPAYQLAFGYPDGTRFVVAGRFTLCGELLVGSVRRARAQPALRTFGDLLWAQREELDPPPPLEPETIRCDQPRRDQSDVLLDDVGLAVAVFCLDGKRTVLPPADRATLVASWRRHVVPTETTFGCVMPLRGAVIVGANSWGDPVTLTWDCLGFSVSDDLEWRPRGPARKIVLELARQAR